MAVPIITITRFPIRNRGYFEWLYTGLQILESEGKIELVHEGEASDLFLRKHPRVYGKLMQYAPGLADLLSPNDHFSLTGRMDINGKSCTFAYDVTDSPFTYALAHLEMVDVYFKTQCPISFEPEGYPLSSEIRVPYHPDVLLFQDKIRPAMSTGPITSTLNLKRNLSVLELNKSYLSEEKTTRIFASFGGDRGPKPWKRDDFKTTPHNYMNERSILARYPEIQHPNEKRAHVVKILRSMHSDSIDARIWNTGDASIQGDAFEWSDYLRAVGKSVWNINVSGFRRSLPFRFLDSFQVGCGIATDTIGTRWHEPFDHEIEVVEFGDLGYETAEKTNWKAIQSRLMEIYDSADLDHAKALEIRELFDQKWHPRRLGEYFVRTCLEQLDQQ